MKRFTTYFLAFMACFVACPDQVVAQTTLLGLELESSFLAPRGSYTFAVDEQGKLWFVDTVAITSSAGNYLLIPADAWFVTGIAFANDFIVLMVNGGEPVSYRNWVYVLNQQGDIIYRAPIFGKNAGGADILWSSNGGMMGICDASFTPADTLEEKGYLFTVFSGGYQPETGVYHCTLYPDSVWAEFQFYPLATHTPLTAPLAILHHRNLFYICDFFYWGKVCVYSDTISGPGYVMAEEEHNLDLILALSGTLEDLWVLAYPWENEPDQKVVYHFIPPLSARHSPVVSSTEYHLFPNPTNSFFVISGPEGMPQQVTVYNLLGQIIHQEKFFGRTQISAPWSSGMYFVRVENQTLKLNVVR